MLTLCRIDEALNKVKAIEEDVVEAIETNKDKPGKADVVYSDANDLNLKAYLNSRIFHRNNTRACMETFSTISNTSYNLYRNSR